MFLIDDLLLSPISGVKFVLRTVLNAAEQQWTDDAPLKERLLELQLKLENGEVTEEEYVQEERGILAELRDIQRRKMELAGVDPDSVEAERGAIGGENKPSIEISVPPEVRDHGR